MQQPHAECRLLHFLCGRRLHAAPRKGFLEIDACCLHTHLRPRILLPSAALGGELADAWIDRDYAYRYDRCRPMSAGQMAEIGQEEPLGRSVGQAFGCPLYSRRRLLPLVEMMCLVPH